MTKEQKEIQEARLDEEKKVIRRLKKVYAAAAADCEEKIAVLNARTDMRNLQSIIYQKQYQQALKSQIDAILATLQTEEFDTISEYLTKCYEDGYAATMYQLRQDGIPVILPIDQDGAARAVQADSKLSPSMYTRLGEDVAELKKSIRFELSRGVANGSSYLDIANEIAHGMNSPYKRAMNNAIRIARTESGRITSQANLDAAYKAKEAGADSVKQWNATLDGRTRPDHRAADGQIRELDEYFDVGGEKMKAPLVGGSARNVCNCRCCMDMKPRWALDDYELERLKERAEYYGLDKTKDFEDFKKKYLQAASEDDTIKTEIQKLLTCEKVNFPPTAIDTSALSVDNEHIAERHAGVTNDDAVSYIENALFSISRWDGRFENYYSNDGAAFVDVTTNTIKSAFKASEYSDNVAKACEVINDE